jgi:hypothetical protein
MVFGKVGSDQERCRGEAVAAALAERLRLSDTELIGICEKARNPKMEFFATAKSV